MAIVINQLATPGLGSWIAGRRVAGAGQLALALTGFGLYVAYFSLVIRDMIRTASSGIAPPALPDGWWKWSLALFGAAWLWSGLTSLQLLVEIRRRRAATGAPIPEPPRLL